MAQFRVFRLFGRRYRLVEDPERRKADLKDGAVTLQDVEENTVHTYYQNRALRLKVQALPLSVKIYNTPREILESMLRAAISDKTIEETLDVGPAALHKRPTHETRTLRAIATEAALSSPVTRGAFDAKIEGGILLLKVLGREFKAKEAEEFASLVFDRLSGLFRKMVVDVREVSYMNSSGISVLARSAGAMPTRIVGASETIRGVMDLMGLLPLLNLDATQEEAIRKLKAEDKP
ncbi:MAG: STAS domain-containing protein [Planctomycetes bacterium]|jgi:anti-anti-sigma factor|nr:STAS domain-containing protein [Planctomycetota bacterium]